MRRRWPCAPPDGPSWSSIPGRRVDSARLLALSKTDAIDARCLAEQACYLDHTDKRERLFMRLPTEEQESLLA
jgi:hypothetical protein